MLRRILMPVGLALMFGFYIHGALRHSSSLNVVKEWVDQSAYMDYAKKMKQTNYRYAGNRNRMPLYPFIQSLFYRSNMTDDEFFHVGKTVNVGLSVFILVCLFTLFARLLSLFSAINLQLIIMFTLFVFKAAYFQAEILFYFLNFLGILSMSSLFFKPRLMIAFLTGVILGLAHLTKASILPGLLLFSLCFGLKLIWDFRSQRDRPSDQLATGKGQSALYRIGCLLSVIAVFIALIFPYISTSKKLFGRYFYNINSTFYMWYDSWEEVRNDKLIYECTEWPAVEPKNLPGPRKYVQNHSMENIFERFLVGTSTIYRWAKKSFGFFSYAVAYFLFLLLTIGANWHCFLSFARENLFPVIFVTIYFVAYFLLYAWYLPIGLGLRFVLSLFLPFMFCCAWLTARIQSMGSVEQTGYVVKLKSLKVFNIFIFAILMINIFTILNTKIIGLYGGS